MKYQFTHADMSVRKMTRCVGEDEGKLEPHKLLAGMQNGQLYLKRV
jgi:hypothetical protein